MPRIYEVTDIDWDTDDEEVEGLPESATVEFDDDEEDDLDDDDGESNVVNRLTDEHGWCINDCRVRRVS